MLLNSRPSWENSSRPLAGTGCSKSPRASRRAAARNFWIWAWSARDTNTDDASASTKNASRIPKITLRLSETALSSPDELSKTATSTAPPGPAVTRWAPPR